MARREMEGDIIVQQLRALGVAPGGALLVHASFRAARPVEGGPLGLIEALRAALGPEGTLAFPSWTEDDDAPFDPAHTPAARDLGVTAETFRHLPGVRRSDHPFAVAALGPCAARIADTPLPTPPHGPDGPIGRVLELDGRVLLLGVGHDANTLLHLAESLAGVPYGAPKHCTVARRGRPARIEYREPDHCCRRFVQADDWLRPRGLQAEGAVGHANSRLFRARDLIDIALPRLRADPLLFLCPPETACAECDAARASI